eukprot:5250578-Prymnesium_polylepis.1
MGMERRGRVAPCIQGRREGQRVAAWRMHTGTAAAHQPRRRASELGAAEERSMWGVAGQVDA